MVAGMCIAGGSRSLCEVCEVCDARVLLRVLPPVVQNGQKSKSAARFALRFSHV
jgi:hypothetical protein